jgi:SAM-dependent methyltransferase
VRPPPRARELAIELIANFDDEALGAFLAPDEGGVDPADLGVALRGCAPTLVVRVAGALPDAARTAFNRAHGARADAAVERARRRVLDRLFWPLVYWNDPDDYEDLVAGERVHPRVVDTLELAGRDVCDIGAGAGRFTLIAARRARRVIAVDVVTPLLQRLEGHARAAGATNIEVRRGRFTALPLADASVDLAVACSSFTSHGPHGGERVLAEAARIVRPGGDVAVIWPQEPAWFRARGFTHISVHGGDAVHFRDVPTAERLCRRYHSLHAARWVRLNQRADVPYAVLSVRPPNDVCVKRVVASTLSR